MKKIVFAFLVFFGLGILISCENPAATTNQTNDPVTETPVDDDGVDFAPPVWLQGDLMNSTTTTTPYINVSSTNLFWLSNFTDVVKYVESGGILEIVYSTSTVFSFKITLGNAAASTYDLYTFTLIPNTEELYNSITYDLYTSAVDATATLTLYKDKKIGDSFQGGILAYFLKPTDPGYDNLFKHGLIASNTTLSLSMVWSLPAYNMVDFGGITSDLIGSGFANTNAIIGITEEGNTFAAGLARSYTGGGYTDWYLPSIRELYELFCNKNAIGGFSSTNYWSSTLYDGPYLEPHDSYVFDFSYSGVTVS